MEENYSENLGYQPVEENYESMPEEEVSVHQYTEEPPAESNPIFRKLIRGLVYAAAFLVPLWFLPFTADVSEFNKQVLLIALAGFGLVLWLVDVIKSGVVRLKSSPFYWPVFGLVGAGVVSVIFSVSRNTSIFGVAGSRAWSLMSLTVLAVLFWLAVNVIEDRGRALRKIMIMSLALAFLYGFLQTFGIYVFKGAIFGSRAFNSVGNLNALGMLAALALALFGNSGKEEENDTSISRYLDIFRYLGLVLALFLVIFINWWPVWAVAFISLLASVAFSSARDASLLKRGRMRLFALPMAVIVLGIFLMLVNFNWTSIKSKLPLQVSLTHGVSWGIVLDSLKTHPLGYGLENFGIAFDKFKPASIANTVFYQVRFTDAVSEAANLMVEGGALMILAFLALLWFYGVSLTSAIKSGFYGTASSSANWAASIGAVAVFFLFPFNLTILAVFFMLLVLAVLSGGDFEERAVDLESSAVYSFGGSVAFIVGLVAVLVAGYFTVNNYIANVYLAKAAQSTDRNKVIEYLVASSNINGQDARVYRVLSQTALAQLADDLKNGPQKDETRENYNARVQNQIASAVNIAIRATNVDPADSQNWVNRGLIYQNLLTLVGGADQAAASTYNESLARHPNDPTTYLRIGNLYLTLADNLRRAGSAGQQINDNLTKAEENFKKAVALYNNYGQALYNLAATYDRLGKVPDAIRQFEKLQAANPRDPSIAFQLGLLYYRNGQKDNAFRAWQQAVFLFPNYSNARWYLSLIHEERGELDKALEQVKEVKKLNPDNELVKQRLAQLEAGRRTIPPEKLLDKKPLD